MPSNNFSKFPNRNCRKQTQPQALETKRNKNKEKPKQRTKYNTNTRKIYGKQTNNYYKWELY